MITSRIRSILAMFCVLALCTNCGGGGGAVATSYTVTYNGNGNTGGSVPTDLSTYQQGGTVTILGNTGSLVDSGSTFSGWTTASDGSGTVYTAGQTLTVGTANITLYAKWTAANVLGYAYVVNYNGGSLGSIAQYTIGSDGSLTPMSIRTVSAAGNDTQYISADPSGKYIYVSNITSNTVGQFMIGSDGTLTAMSTPTVAMGDLSGGKLYYPMGSLVHPNGKWFYVTNNQNGTVNAFTLGMTGSLTSMTTTTLTDPFDASNPKQAISPYAIAIDSTGKYAYVISQVGNSTANAIISQFNINQTTGALEYNNSTMMGSTFITPWDIKIASIASGQYVYVTNHQNSTLWEYSINSDGTLTSIGTLSVSSASGAAAHTISIHPSGKYAYVTMLAGTPNTVIAQLNINQSNGTLSLMSTPAVSAGGTAAEVMAIDPAGMYAYSTSADSGWGSSSISQFTIDQTTGALTLMNTPTVQTNGTGPGGIVVVWK